MRGGTVSGCLVMVAGALGGLYFAWVTLVLGGGSLAQAKEAPPYLIGALACLAAAFFGGWLVRGPRVPRP